MASRVRELSGGLAHAVVAVAAGVSVLAAAGCAKQPGPAQRAALIAPQPQALQPMPDMQGNAPLVLTPKAPKLAPKSQPDVAAPDNDPPVPGDPMADQPPMPMAKLKAKRAAAVQMAAAKPVGLRGSFDGVSRSAAGFVSGPWLLASNDPKWAPVGVVVPDPHLPEDVIAAADPQDAYRLDAGDKVGVTVYGQPSLSRTYAVNAGGTISIPLAGSIKARGLTIHKLKARIAAALGAKYVRDPEVSVEVAEYRPFFILGEVKNAGQFPWVDGMTIQTAVAIAGGYSPRALERTVRLQRRVDGVLSEIDVPPSTAVKPGDTIYVHERFF